MLKRPATFLTNIICTLAMTSGCLFASSTKDNEKLYINDVARGFHNLEHAKNLWPNFDVKRRPIVTLFEAKKNANHLYAFYFTPKKDTWETVTVDNQTAHFSPNDKYNISKFLEKKDGNDYLILGAKLLNIDGTPSIISTPFGDYSGDMQELFRFLLSTMNVSEPLLSYLFLDSPDAKQNLALEHRLEKISYNGDDNADNMALAYIESRLFKDYLKSKDINTLKDFLAVDSNRKSQLSKSDQDYEAHNMFFYNLQSYVARLIYSDIDEQKIPILISHHKSTDDDTVIDLNPPTIELWQMTFLAAPLMNDLKPDWITASRLDNNTFIDQLATLYPLSTDEIKHRTDYVKNAYHYDKILKAAQDKIDDQADDDITSNAISGYSHILARHKIHA